MYCVQADRGGRTAGVLPLGVVGGNGGGGGGKERCDVCMLDP